MSGPKRREPKKAQIEKTVEASTPTVLFFAQFYNEKKFIQEDLDLIMDKFSCTIKQQKNKFEITGRNLDLCRRASIVLEKIDTYLSNFNDIDEDVVEEIINRYIFKPLVNTKFKSIFTKCDGTDISPRTERHEQIINTIKSNTISVIHGSAGTGKSLFSIIMGLKFLNDNRYDRILIVRPISVVGKSLGFLPGDMSEKYMPHASPIVDALIDLVGAKTFEYMVTQKKIVFEPVSMMRGSNFQNSYVIVDECQNMDKIEILTLLTRICYNTKVVITGDESQSDRKGQNLDKSGLEFVVERLSENDEVGFVKMLLADVQRHKIVKEVIEAFE
jgi:phosphate starvation-inducible PhoH-like protein